MSTAQQEMQENPATLLYALDQIVTQRRESVLNRLRHDGYRSIAFSALFRWAGYFPRAFGDRIVQGRTFWGQPMSFPFTTSPDLWTYGLYLDPPEIRLTKYLIRTIKPGQVIFDIGAQFGFYTLLAAALTGAKGRIVSFEPCPMVLPTLRDNVQDLHNVEVIPTAVTASKEPVCLYYETGRRLGLATTNLSNLHEAGVDDVHAFVRSEVPTQTLDCFVETHGVVPDIMKIDVEGGEASALASAVELLRSATPIIAMEVWGKPFTQNYRNAIAILCEAGFSAYSLTEEGTLSCQPVDQELSNVHVGGVLPDDLCGNVVFLKRGELNIEPVAEEIHSDRS